MNTIIDFYQRHELVRWILFIPLTIGIVMLASLALYFINRDIANSFIYMRIISPIIWGGLTVYLLHILAPRWHNFWGWLVFGLGVLNILSSLGAIAYGSSELGIAHMVYSAVFTISALAVTLYIRKSKPTKTTPD